ncbi:MAG: SART-1 family protein [Lachnospiraceae bacterium]|nr:SART-1 family protein [Lachnospiraceae bacterium]
MAKRIVSLIAVVILVGMYIATMICAILATPQTHSMFIGSLVLTVIIPIVLWVFLTLYKRAHKDDDKNITMAEMRKYRKRIRQGEAPEDIAKEIEEKYTEDK